MSTQRADARRNYDRVLTVARAEVAEHGAEISLERLARVAGVGSATVRRHFPSHRAVFEAVFASEVETLCDLARDLAAATDARAALLEWLDALTRHAASTRGMATVLTQHEVGTPHTVEAVGCTRRLIDAGEPLVRRAALARTVAPGTSMTDLLSLVTGIALATGHQAHPVDAAAHLLDLTVVGISPHPPQAHRAERSVG